MLFFKFLFYFSTHTYHFFCWLGAKMKSQTLNPGCYVTIVKELIIIPQLPHL